MSADSVSHTKNCFVISPIGEDGSETRRRSDQVFRYIISPAVAGCGYKAVRADQIDSPGIITTQIINKIVSDDLVVADLTEYNPNVFYELAIRQVLKRPYVQLIEKGQRLPFDVASARTIFVDHRDLEAADAARKEIERQILELEKNPDNVDSPISAALEVSLLRQSEQPEQRSLAELIAGLSVIQSQISKVDGKISDSSAVLAEIRKVGVGIVPSEIKKKPRGERNIYSKFREMEEISMLSHFIENSADEFSVPFSGEMLKLHYISSVLSQYVPWLASWMQSEIVKIDAARDPANRKVLVTRLMDVLGRISKTPILDIYGYENDFTSGDLYELFSRLRALI